MSKGKTTRFEEEPAHFIEEFITTNVTESLENRLCFIDDSPIFEEPLVGFADGEDPLFYEYKKIIGLFHLTPREILEQSLPLTPYQPKEVTGDISVICWALPIAKRTIASNARKDAWPSLRWSHTSDYGKKFNLNLMQRLVTFLNGEGCFAVAPVLTPLFWRLENRLGEPTSNWSERHALYVAGMGTFGLSDGFITPRGKAVRCGSVIVNLQLPPTPRKYGTHTENCPFYSDRSCGVCIDRCPAGAITGSGHDKIQCRNYRFEHLGHLRQRYGVETVGCGLCLTGVPCESKIPPAATQGKEGNEG